jgi:hypothetical protein
MQLSTVQNGGIWGLRYHLDHGYEGLNDIQQQQQETKKTDMDVLAQIMARWIVKVTSHPLYTVSVAHGRIEKDCIRQGYRVNVSGGPSTGSNGNGPAQQCAPGSTF